MRRTPTSGTVLPPAFAVFSTAIGFGNGWQSISRGLLRRSVDAWCSDGGWDTSSHTNGRIHQTGLVFQPVDRIASATRFTTLLLTWEGAVPVSTRGVRWGY